MNSQVIDFDLRGIASELKERFLGVPIYQRSYSWDKDEIAEYWNDLQIAFQGSSDYFLGTIVLTRKDETSSTVIDGQQRLATTAILLAAIRDELLKRGDAVRANAVQGNYLSQSDVVSGAIVPKITLNSEDSNFFEKRIIAGEATPGATKSSHELILAAYDFFRTQTNKIADDAGPAWAQRLGNWTMFLQTRARAMVLEVSSDADAFLIFETLNDRGADLTIADLLKNYVFGRAGPAKLDAVRDGWMQVLGALDITAENKLFTTFLRHYWSSLHGAVRERELYKSIKERVVTATQVSDFVANLQDAAVIYAALLNSNNDYWDELGTTVRGYLDKLLRLELEQNRPLLLAALHYFTTDEKKKLLRSLVSWSVRGLVVGGIGGGTAEKAYCGAAVKIRSGAIKTTPQVLQEISSIVPSDEDFKTAFAMAKVPKANIARYFLCALEEGKKGTAEPEFVPNSNEEKINLEHVLPKRATAADWGADFNGDERKEYVHRLGNLALLQKGPNGKIGNKPFAVKKSQLALSGFELTKAIGGNPDWTKETIAKRQGELAELAIKVWPR